MPILDVEIVGRQRLPSDLAQRLADAAGELCGSPAGSTWVKLRSIAPTQYAENATPDAAHDSRPVFVSVLLSARPTGEHAEQLAASLARGVAEVVSRPVECVHVIFSEAGVGRVAFGGKLLR